MNPESKSHILTVAEIVGLCIAVLVAGLLIGTYIIGGRDAAPDTENEASNTDGAATSNTVSAISGDVRVPEAGEEISDDVAVPLIVTEAAPGVDARFRSFTVTVDGNSFSPSQLVVRQGDTTRITFKALDKTYDFTQPDLGLSRILSQGQDSVVEVAPQATGKFMFFCTSCGGPDAGPVGYLTVAPR